MNSAFLQSLQDFVKKKNSIAILPFFDTSTLKKDSRFQTLFPFAIYNSFATTKGALLHPYLTLEKEMNPKKPNLFDKLRVKRVAQKLKARYVILGNYQKLSENTIRVNITAYDNNTDDFLSPTEQITAKLDDSLLSHIQAAADRVFRRLKVPIKAHRFPEQPSLLAFRFYTKGMALAHQYSPTKLRLSQIWLEKAMKESHFTYFPARLALARTYAMQALWLRLKHKSNAEKWDRYQKWFRSDLYPDAILPNHPSLAIAERFEKAEEAFQKAIRYAQNRDIKKAIKHAEEGLFSVPEDGMLVTLIKNKVAKKKTKHYNKLTDPVCL